MPLAAALAMMIDGLFERRTCQTAKRSVGKTKTRKRTSSAANPLLRPYDHTIATKNSSERQQDRNHASAFAQHRAFKEQR